VQGISDACWASELTEVLDGGMADHRMHKLLKYWMVAWQITECTSY